MNGINVYGNNVNFQAKPNRLLWEVTHIGTSKTPATPAHYKNTFFKTNINNYLRNPNATTVDLLNDMALSNCSRGTFYAFASKEQKREVINRATNTEPQNIEKEWKNNKEKIKAKFRIK